MSSRSQYLWYEDHRYRMLRHHESVVAQRLKDGRLFCLAVQDLPKCLPWKMRRARVSWALVGWSGVLLIATWTASVLISGVRMPVDIYVTLGPGLGVLFVLYVVLQTSLHESAHVFVLRMLGERPDRLGVRLDFGVVPTVWRSCHHQSGR